MAIEKTALETMIREAFPDASFELVDTAGDNDHYSLTIKSEQFRGIPRIKQHQMVYQALGGKMGGALHALQLKTVTE